MDLRHYAALLRHWLWLLVLGATLAGGVTYFVSRREPPVYDATATVLVNQAQSGVGQSYNDVLASLQLSKTYANLVKSRSILDAAARTLGINGLQSGNVSADVVRDTQLIAIHARDNSPQQAGRIANEVAQQLRNQVAQVQGTQFDPVRTDIQYQIATVQASIDQTTQEIVALNGQTTTLAEDQRQGQLAAGNAKLSSLNSTMQGLQSQLRDLALSAAKSSNSVTLVESAIPPAAPVKPRPVLDAGLAAVLGFLVAAAIAAAVEYLDDTVKDAEDVTRAAGISTLGILPRFADQTRSKKEPNLRNRPYLLTEVGNQNYTLEGYRVVRTNLQFAENGRRKQTLVVASARPREGKSTTAANLAMVVATGGQRVILVDADLRRPTIHQTFNVSNTVGLTTLFFAEAPTLASVMKPTLYANLRVIPSGPLPPNPADLLSSDRMAGIIQLLSENADVVLFDTPPILSVPDTATLAPRVDGVIYVVEAGHTRTALVRQATDSLRQASANVLGAIINKQERHRGHDYYSSYGYGYGSRSDSISDTRSVNQRPTKPA